MRSRRLRGLPTAAPAFPDVMKALLFVAALLPLVRAGFVVITGQAVNPVEFVTHVTGTWALVGLMVTLAVSPLRWLTGRGWLLRLRRMLGLFAFFYACLHLLTYLWLDQFFDWRAIGHDILKRPFITLGMAAFVLLVPLAVTSTDAWMRRLKRSWGRLHRLVYPAAVLAVVHYCWLVKRDLTVPLIYAGVLALLLGLRLLRRYRERTVC